MPGVEWNPKHTAIVLFFASRNQPHVKCCNHLKRMTGSRRSVNAIRNKLREIRDNHKHLWDMETKWQVREVDQWIIDHEVSRAELEEWENNLKKSFKEPASGKASER